MVDMNRCAQASQTRQEDLVATASRVTRWVVVEQPGSWGEDALTESKLDEQIGRTLASAGRRHRFRTLLIRRPGWRKPEGPRKVYLAHSRRTGSWLEQLDVDDVHDLVHLDWHALDSPTPPGIGAPGPPSLHLVCTNGKHDPCCADEGRPVVRALDEAGTRDVWECSHVGGDRFAANIVCLPSGVYFGRVGAEEASALLEDFGDGLLDLERFRGRSCLSALAQAAEIFARRELSERRLGAIDVRGADARSSNLLAVQVSHGDRVYEVVVSRQRAEPQLLSCGATPSPPWRYQLESFER